jgi:hypothetical protein
VPIEGFESVLEFASENGYSITLPSKADDDSDLYGLLVRHKLKDVYEVLDVIEPDAVEA